MPTICNLTQNHRIENCDIFNLFRSIDSCSVDLIIADPPYFQVCGDFDFQLFKDLAEYIAWSRAWMLEARRVLKPTGTLMLWGGVGGKTINMARLAIMIEDESLFTRQNWITQKNTRGYGTKRNYMSCREELLFLTKSDSYTFNVPYLEEKSTRKDLGANGKPRKNEFKRVSNVWSDIAEASQSSIERCAHPTVKAQKLCDRIVLTHSNPGDLVLIPFVGSGSEVISAIKNDRKAIGAEIDAEYFALACQRIRELAGLSEVSDEV